MAALDEAFFKANFGESITNETDARVQIANLINREWRNKADTMLFFAVYEKLMLETKFDLPETFLNRWVKAQNPKKLDSAINSEFPIFIKNLRWSLIRATLFKENKVALTQNDVVEIYLDQLKGFFGGQLPFEQNIIESLVERTLNDEKQYTELLEKASTAKAVEIVKEQAVLNIVKVSKEEFDILFEDFDNNLRAKSEQNNVAQEAKVETEELAESIVEIENEAQ
ncbi:MAG: hypothetical protein HC817_02045 [Saprospiraceae bacterium]|nr:hypothetical protein [Saprospiraceae bacterium]